MNINNINPNLLDLITDEHKLMMKIFGNSNGKVRIQVPGIHQYSNEGPFSKQIDQTDIKEGDELYYYEESGEFIGWIKIKVTCIRSGVIFFVKIENQSKEQFIIDNSVAVRIGALQPIKYIVDTQKYPTDIYEFVAQCPYTEIIYK